MNTPAPQPCLHPNARHQHGTRTAYIADRCRCPDCCTANTTYEQNRVRAHLYGLWTTTVVNSEPARRHVNTLRAAGPRPSPDRRARGCLHGRAGKAALRPRRSPAVSQDQHDHRATPPGRPGSGPHRLRSRRPRRRTGNPPTHPVPGLGRVVDPAARRPGRYRQAIPASSAAARPAHRGNRHRSPGSVRPDVERHSEKPRPSRRHRRHPHPQPGTRTGLAPTNGLGQHRRSQRNPHPNRPNQGQPHRVQHRLIRAIHHRAA